MLAPSRRDQRGHSGPCNGPARIVPSDNSTTYAEHHRSLTINNEATYICGECGEEIVVPIDLTEGRTQQYVEDCPVCCRANVIHVEVDDDGEARAWGQLE